MNDCRYLPPDFDRTEALSWVVFCATSAGWSGEEADRLAHCVTDSAVAVSQRAYALSKQGPVFVKLSIEDDDAHLELSHEGAVGDKPCDCAAAKAAVERRSSNWLDGQLRTHRLRIERAG